jgi:chromate reductase, NAD(P)H dehydrogenase (quinone)
MTNLRRPVRFLVFSASLRGGALNMRLAGLAANVIESNGGIVDRGSMAEFDCPSFNGDVPVEQGVSRGADEFRHRVELCDALVIASPEYNGSVPGVLKNAIDWVSRFPAQPFSRRHGLFLSASSSLSGGNRGLWSLRIPLETLGVRVFPDMFSLATADRAFDQSGRLADPQLQGRLESTLVAFMDLVEASKHYPLGCSLIPASL